MMGDMWWLFPIAGAVGAVAILVGLLVLIFWIWMIVDCARRRFRNDVEKIVWLAVVILGGWLGALIYLLVVRVSNPMGLAKK